MSRIFQQHFALSHRLSVVAASVFCAASIIHSQQMNISSGAGLLPLTSITWWCLSFISVSYSSFTSLTPLFLWGYLCIECLRACWLWTHPDSPPLEPFKEMMLTLCSVICGPGSLFLCTCVFCLCVYQWSRCPCRSIFYCKNCMESFSKDFHHLEKPLYKCFIRITRSGSSLLLVGECFTYHLDVNLE